jgi:hypothetical protein
MDDPPSTATINHSSKNKVYFSVGLIFIDFEIVLKGREGESSRKGIIALSTVAVWLDLTC